MKKTRKIQIKPNYLQDFSAAISNKQTHEEFIKNISQLYKLNKEWQEITLDDCAERLSNTFLRIMMKEGDLRHFYFLSTLSDSFNTGIKPDNLSSLLFEAANSIFKYCTTENCFYMYRSLMFLAAQEGNIYAGINITTWLLKKNIYDEYPDAFFHIGYHALDKIIKNEAPSNLPDLVKIRYAIFSQDPLGLQKAEAFAANNPEKYQLEISTINTLLQVSSDLLGHMIVFNKLTPMSHGGDDLKLFEALEGKPLTLIPSTDHEKVRVTLETEFPWCKNAIDTIIRQLEFNYFSDGTVNLRPLLLYGAPGCGKSRFARRLAEILSLPFTNINVGGSSDAMILKGTTRGWSTGRASIVSSIIQQRQTANPMILLDEIDKESTNSNNGRLTDTLHQLLETETSAQWFDEYLLGNCNFSRVNWIATANRISNLTSSLLNRFDVIEIIKPPKTDYPNIFHSILNEIIKNAGLVHFKYTLNFNSEEIDFACNKASSPRHLKKLVESLITIKLRTLRERMH